jgi:glucosamine-6-phosphate deaminase
VAASFLQRHPAAEVVLDPAAAAELTRFKAPWLLGPVAWDERTIRKAVVWLARKGAKPILKLTDEDYNEAGLQDLVAGSGPAYDLNIAVFRALGETITGWPGGKPEARKRPGDRHRARDLVFPKRVLVFSPHPDDDVIAMGGTLMRLVAQGHEVHVAYQTRCGSRTSRWASTGSSAWRRTRRRAWRRGSARPCGPSSPGRSIRRRCARSKR